MKIYQQGITPSAKRVSIFLAEKGIEIEREEIDLKAGDNLTESFKGKSVNGKIPLLELDDGTTLCESVAICRYFEELYPEKTPLFGNSALEKAQIEMWIRVIELHGFVPAFQAFRNLTGFFSDRENCVEAWGAESKERLVQFLPTLDKQLSEQSYIVGEHFSVADISAFVLLGFSSMLEVVPGEELPHLSAWQQRIAQRPSIQSLAE